MGKKLVRGGIFPLVVFRRKMRADISFSYGSEQCVCNRMEQDITVAMPHRMLVVGNVDSSQS